MCIRDRLNELLDVQPELRELAAKDGILKNIQLENGESKFALSDTGKYLNNTTKLVTMVQQSVAKLDGFQDLKVDGQTGAQTLEAIEYVIKCAKESTVAGINKQEVLKDGMRPGPTLERAALTSSSIVSSEAVQTSLSTSLGISKNGISKGIAAPVLPTFGSIASAAWKGFNDAGRATVRNIINNPLGAAKDAAIGMVTGVGLAVGASLLGATAGAAITIGTVGAGILFSIEGIKKVYQAVTAEVPNPQDYGEGLGAVGFSAAYGAALGRAGANEKILDRVSGLRDSRKDNQLLGTKEEVSRDEKVLDSDFLENESKLIEEFGNSLDEARVEAYQKVAKKKGIALTPEDEIHLGLKSSPDDRDLSRPTINHSPQKSSMEIRREEASNFIDSLEGELDPAAKEKIMSQLGYDSPRANPITKSTPQPEEAVVRIVRDAEFNGTSTKAPATGNATSTPSTDERNPMTSFADRLVELSEKGGLKGSTQSNGATRPSKVEKELGEAEIIKLKKSKESHSAG